MSVNSGAGRHYRVCSCVQPSHACSSEYRFHSTFRYHQNSLRRATARFDYPSLITDPHAVDLLPVTESAHSCAHAQPSDATYVHPSSTLPHLPFLLQHEPCTGQATPACFSRRPCSAERKSTPVRGQARYLSSLILRLPHQVGTAACQSTPTDAARSGALIRRLPRRNLKNQ